MKHKKQIEVVWDAVSGIIRTQRVYDAAVAAVSDICGGDGSLFKERVYEPLLSRWLASNPQPERPGPDASRPIKAEFSLKLREHEMERRNFQAAMSYLKLRAGLRIKRTGARKSTVKAKAKASKAPVIPLSGGPITAKTLVGMLKSVMAASGWSLEILETKLAIAVTELHQEEK